MPTLEWLCKEKVVNHHLDVPYRILERQYSFDAAGIRAEDNGSENMIVRGDNLEALKALLPRYEGRVKCVYIDPPYNTGNENWVYNDNVNDPRIRKWLRQLVGKEGEDLSRHDKWLCMTYPRLRLLHKLLADDGILFASIDYNENSNLRLILDDIFGSQNFVGEIYWESKTKSQNTLTAYNKLQPKLETIYVYSKKGRKRFNLISVGEKEYPLSDLRGNYREYLLEVMNAEGMRGRESMIFPITVENTTVCLPPRKQWKLGQDQIAAYQSSGDVFIREGKVVIKMRPEYERTNKTEPFWGFLSKEIGTAESGKKELNAIIPDHRFETVKPVDLIKRLIYHVCDKNDIILDSFAGSGTTAHAVLALNKADGGNRRFILVEMLDYAESLTAERVKRVIQGYPTKEERTLFDEEITAKNLASGAELLEGAKAAAQEAKDSGLYEKISKPQIKDGRLQVVATLKAEVSAQGTGGDFSFYELGAPLLVDERLNPSAPLEKIREYIWFTETKTPFSPVADDNEYYLGTFNDAAYYFYYKSDETTTLDAAFLASVKSKSDLTIVYADRCAVDAKKLKRLGVVFKKIPRDINGR